MIQIKLEITTTDPMTIAVKTKVSRRDGHMTLRSSARTSLRNRAVLSKNPFAENFNVSHPATVKYPDTRQPVYRLPERAHKRRVPRKHPAHNGWQARRDSNPQPTVLETAALPVRATGLRQALFDTRVSGLPGLSMDGVCPAELAVLLELDPGRIILLVLHRRVVPSLALRTSERDDLSHEAHPHSTRKTLENRFINLPHRVIHVKKRAGRLLAHLASRRTAGEQMELTTGIEPVTSSLPRTRSAD